MTEWSDYASTEKSSIDDTHIFEGSSRLGGYGGAEMQALCGTYKKRRTLLKQPTRDTAVMINKQVC